MDEAELRRQFEAATIYEEYFVPALFQQWSPMLAAAAGTHPGQHVLDVGCGTGILARTLAPLVKPGGSVVGLDSNPGMLAVAGGVAPEIEWQLGAAESLPYPDRSFDAVFCQFGLMFFDDPPRALREMWRVLAPGGRLVTSVWDRLDRIPAYSILVALLQHRLGDRVADALRGPFSLGDTAALERLFTGAGISPVTIETRAGRARYPSIRSWVLTDVKGWFPIVQVTVPEADYAVLLDDAEKALSPFVRPNGSIEFPITVHVVTADAPA
jgi:SAM-dependent methyltransferase